MLDSLAKTALRYREVGLCHGDIQPRTVHLTADLQVVLMDNALLFPKHRENFSKALANPAYRAALSPLQLQSLAHRDSFFSHNPTASEVWAVGVTVLCFAGLRNLEHFYDWPAKRIRFDLFESELQRLEAAGYSRIFANLLRAMLSCEEARRPAFETVLACSGLMQSQQSVLWECNKTVEKQGLANSIDCRQPL